MATTRRANTAAAEAAQEAQDAQKISQGTQGQETVPAAPDAPQEGTVTKAIIGPDGPEELLGCQDADEAELAEALLQPYAVTAKSGLRLRTEPRLDAPIITVLPCGAGVFAGGEPGPDGWRHVFTGRLSGWMMDRHLEPLLGALSFPGLGHGAE